jgi:hypothetical protein
MMINNPYHTHQLSTRRDEGLFYPLDATSRAPVVSPFSNIVRSFFAAHES